MKVLILGAAGMVGRKLTQRLLQLVELNGQAISSLMLADTCEAKVQTPGGSSIAVESIVTDLSAAPQVDQLIAHQPDIIFHLAAVVSGEAETNMDLGYRVNLDGMRFVLQAIHEQHKQHGYQPRLIFSSSIAVYGAPFPETISDEFLLSPMTSYGTQKAISEYLLADYHRRSIITGVGLRFPTLVVRPGKPNRAASSFFSNIIREPIHGRPAVLPVEPELRHWFASPRAAIDFLLHACTLSADQIGLRCNMNLPGLCASVEEQIESLRRVVGSGAVALIRKEPDTAIQSIVNNWPMAFSAQRALELGFKAESGFDELIKVYLEDDYQSA